MTRLLTLATLALLPTSLLLVLAAPAGAHRRTVAPPGNSAVSQYLEVVPSSTGATPPGTGGPRGDALSAAQTHHLENLGPDGRTLAAVVEETAPPAAGDTVGGGRSAGPATRAGGSAPPISGSGAGSPASLILGAAAGGGGGGLGIFLPGLMLASALAAVAYAVLRRRTSL